MRIAQNLTGRVFNNWTVEGLAYITNYQRYWLCRCVCGRKVAVFSSNLKNGTSKSCGCVRDALTRARTRTHGHTVNGHRSPEYQTWMGINKRCNNAKTKAYKDYGGRGIKVCDEWRHDFATFVRDMGLRPTQKHSIERRDNDGGYEPSNCYWATKAEQSRNTRRNRFIEHDGRRQTLGDWATEYGIDRLILLKRLKRGWPIHRALTRALMPGHVRYVSFNGHRRPMTEWAKITGIAKGTIDQRLRNGWSLDRALTTPTRPIRLHSDKSLSS